MWCAGEGASGGVGGVPWWVCEGGGAMSPGGGSPGRRGPGVSTSRVLQAEFYARMQSVGETLAEYSRALIRLHQRIEGAAPTVAERQALAVL